MDGSLADAHSLVRAREPHDLHQAVLLSCSPACEVLGLVRLDLGLQPYPVGHLLCLIVRSRLEHPNPERKIRALPEILQFFRSQNGNAA